MIIGTKIYVTRKIYKYIFNTHPFFLSETKDEILRLAGVDLETEGLPGLENSASTPPLGRPVVPSSLPEATGEIPTPQTGISIPMAVTPRFHRAVPEEAELLYTAPESLFDEIVRAEAERISQPEGVKNRIVYDSVTEMKWVVFSGIVSIALFFFGVVALLLRFKTTDTTHLKTKRVVLSFKNATHVLLTSNFGIYRPSKFQMFRVLKPAVIHCNPGRGSFQSRGQPTSLQSDRARCSAKDMMMGVLSKLF